MDKHVLLKVILIPIILLLIVIITVLPVFIRSKKRPILGKDIIYNDRYMELYPDYMILNGFYYGPIGRKKISFDSISKVKMIDLNFWKGSYRIQGTGDFKTWFAHDMNRPSKKIAFIIHRGRKWWRIAFSAEDVEKVASIFESKGLMVQTKPS